MVAPNRRREANGFYPTGKWVVWLLLVLVGWFSNSWLNDVRVEATAVKSKMNIMQTNIDVNNNRLTALETNYSNILRLLDENKRTNERVESKLDAHMLKGK